MLKMCVRACVCVCTCFKIVANSKGTFPFYNFVNIMTILSLNVTLNILKQVAGI